MKKCIYLAALICGVMSFSSCSTADDLVIDGSNSQEVAVQNFASNIKATFGNSIRTLSIGQTSDPTQTSLIPRTTKRKAGEMEDPIEDAVEDEPIFETTSSADFTVNYICSDGCVLGSETFTGEVGDVVYASDKLLLFSDHGFEAADKDWIVLSENVEDNVINLYYIHSTSYMVKYFDEDTSSELVAPMVVNNKKVGEVVSVSEVNITGYECSNPGEQTKVLSENPANNIFTFSYKKIVEPETPSEGEATEPETPEEGGTTEPETPSDGGATEPETPSEGGATEPETPTEVPTTPITPAIGHDVVVTFDAPNVDLYCEADDFCIKYNQYEMEYAFADGSSITNLNGLKLKKDEKIQIAIEKLNEWTNGEKIYWLDLGNGFERACFDIRLYNCCDENGNALEKFTLNKMLNLNYINKSANCHVEVDSIATVDKYGNINVHISILVDRLKATE